MRKLRETSILGVFLIVATTVALYPFGKSYATVPGNNSFVSVNDSGDGEGGNNQSGVNIEGLTSMVSANGKYVAFDSKATNLVANDTNATQDVFVRDITTNITTRVSLTNSGGQSSDINALSAISATGRFVLYTSSATLYGSETIYVRDTKLNTTTDVSGGSTTGNGPGTGVYTWGRGISSDGRFILASGQDAGNWHVYMLDRSTNVWSMLDPNGGKPIASSDENAKMNCDGSLIVFDSPSSTLTSDTPNGHSNVFLIDLRSGGVITNLTKNADADSVNPTISCNGDYIGFVTKATNLISGVGNGVSAHFMKYDRPDDSLSLIDAQTGGLPTGTNFEASGYPIGIDDKGNSVFQASGGGTQIFLRTAAGTTEVISRNAGATAGNHTSVAPTISADGKLTVYRSAADNLTSSDTNGWADIFLSQTGL